jgi:hypothetical protein
MMLVYSLTGTRVGCQQLGNMVINKSDHRWSQSGTNGNVVWLQGNLVPS